MMTRVREMGKEKKVSGVCAWGSTQHSPFGAQGGFPKGISVFTGLAQLSDANHRFFPCGDKLLLLGFKVQTSVLSCLHDGSC